MQRNLSRGLFMRGGSVIENSSTTLPGCSARCHALGTFGFAAIPAEDDRALEYVLTEARANADLIGRRAGHSDRPLPNTLDYRMEKPKLGQKPAWSW